LKRAEVLSLDEGLAALLMVFPHFLYNQVEIVYVKGEKIFKKQRQKTNR
jgi:hypothetical protein